MLNNRRKFKSHATSMRKLLVAMLLFPLFVFAKGPQIKFLNSVHEFGNIKEKGGIVSTSFKFVNTGDAPLVILNATANCGCTKPTFPDAPVAPGDTAAIAVTFDPDGKAGEVNKTIKVTSNSVKGSVARLKIKGAVIPPNR